MKISPTQMENFCFVNYIRNNLKFRERIKLVLRLENVFFYRILLYGILFIFKVKTFLIEAFRMIRLRCYSDNSRTN